MKDGWALSLSLPVSLSLAEGKGVGFWWDLSEAKSIRNQPSEANETHGGRSAKRANPTKDDHFIVWTSREEEALGVKKYNRKDLILKFTFFIDKTHLSLKMILSDKIREILCLILDIILRVGNQTKFIIITYWTNNTI